MFYQAEAGGWSWQKQDRFQSAHQVSSGPVQCFYEVNVRTIAMTSRGEPSRNRQRAVLLRTDRRVLSVPARSMAMLKLHRNYTEISFFHN